MHTAILQAGQMNRSEQLESLLDEVLKRHQSPEDRHEIAAIIESFGWNDSRAAETFGVADVFELADILWERCNTKINYASFSKVEKLSLYRLIVLLTRQFLRGVIFAIPMAVSVVSMLTLKYSLWSYEYLSVELATSIAIGTILSFITVGGFTQAIARRGFFYIIQGYYNMARRITFHFIRLGFLFCIGISVLIFALNVVIKIYPIDMLMVIILYFFFLNTIWLSVTVMYILKKELLFTGLIVVGIGIVYLLFSVLEVTKNIIIPQLIALSMVSIISMGLVIYFFKKEEKKAEKGISPQLPKMSVTIFSTLPYFIYGTLYFTFLFIDRVVAWSRTNEFMPYLIWFRGDYELGLDFALLVLIIPMGISEMVLTKMMMDIEVSQKSYWGNETTVMNRHYIKVYFHRLLQIFLAALLSAVGLYWILTIIFSKFTSISAKSLFATDETHLVFIISLIAYVFVAMALMNAVILFSLSQPDFIIRSIWISLLVNAGSGFLLSRWIDYEFAVFGLLIGSIVFVILSTRNVMGVLRKLDYYLYAAS